MGDVKNAIKKLHAQTKLVKFDFGSNLKELTNGTPTHYLTLYHHLFLNFSPILANEILTKHQLELANKSDKAFIEGVYKLLRDMFDYVPKLTLTQFFMTSYAQVKATMAFDIIGLVLKKCKSLQPVHITSEHNSIKSNITSNPATQSQTKSVQPLRSASLIVKKSSFKSLATIRNHSVKPTLAVQNSPQMSPIETSSTSNSSDLVDHQALKVQNLESVIVDLNTKLKTVETKLEALVNQNEILLQKATIPNEIVQLSRADFDSLISRITILETELLIRKNSSVSNVHKADDQNETTFHSFLNATNDFNSSVIVNGNYVNATEDFTSPKVKNGFICQGLPIEYDKVNELSLNSNDSTPTLNSVSKESKINHVDHIESNLNILKAKDAVLRASLFCNDLIKINQQSKS